MGNCQNNNTAEDTSFDVAARTVENEPRGRVSVNPFFETDMNDLSHDNILSRYRFQSKYVDQFLGNCSVLEEKATGNLFLCKEMEFSDEGEMKKQLGQLERRKNNLTSENIIRIREAFSKCTDGFFSDKYRIILIIDYPFMNFEKQLFNRINKQISFTKEEAMNFITSTIRGYADLERNGFKTDKVRLKNIFIGIRNREPFIKVTETNLLASDSNYSSMLKNGPYDENNRDIYLSPEEFDSWTKGEESFVPHHKSGVFSLGMGIMDICIMDPSRQSYLFTEKRIDPLEIQHRIEICGKKYGGGVEKLLKSMLDFDLSKRYSFQELEEKLPVFSRSQDSKMHLSVIPSQRSSYIHNDNTNLKSSSLFKSVVSDYNNNSRVFASKIKVNRSPEELESVIEHYTNGNKYAGQKKNNMKHGRGKYEFKDGSFYEGEWAENKINGNGILYFPSGKVEYSGEWMSDEYNGWGTLFSDGDKWVRYDGEFKNGVREGRGKMHFSDGAIYDGEFRGGKISGRGRKVCFNGEVLDKYWETMSPEFFMSDP